MSKLCYPAIALMNKLRYVQKFILICALFTTPLLLLLLLLVSDIDNRNLVIQRELDGTHFLRALRLLRERVPQMQSHEHMFASGITPTLDQLNKTQSQLEDDLKMLLAVDHTFGLELDTTTQTEAIATTYSAIKQRIANHQYAALPNNAGTTGSSDNTYAQFENQIQSLMVQVGERSSLVLDPDLTTYFVINTVLDKLPATQDLLAQARILGQAITNRKVITQAERSQLLVQIDMLQANNEALKKSLEMAFNLKPELKAALATPLEAALNNTNNLIEQIKQGITGTTLPKLKPDDYAATASSAITATFNLWDQTLNSLDKLLEEQQNNLTQKKILTMGVALLVVLLVSYFLVGFYLSVRNTVKRLALASKQMIEGSTHQQLVELDNKDELGEVVRSFNQVAAALISTSTELRLRQNSSEQISQQVLDLAIKLKLTATQQASGNVQQLDTVNQVNTTATTAFQVAEQVTQLTQQVSDRVNLAATATEQIKATTSQAAQQSERGLEAVSQTIAQSREGENFYQRLVQTMQELSAKGSSSRQILELISGIAQETHLLALNASIEAAGAGQYGERFNIIAQEVKNLANRCAVSSREVVKVIEELEREMESTQELASASYLKAQSTADKAKLAGEVIEELLDISMQSEAQAEAIGHATEQIRVSIKLIREAAVEQRFTSQSLLENSSGLSVIAQQNAEGSQLVSATAVSLEEVSHTLTTVLAA